MPEIPAAPPTAALSERAVERAMWLNIAAGAFGTFWIGAAYGTPLPLFLQAVQATGFQLGLMGAVRQLALLAQLPSAFFVERLERRKTFWAVVVIAHRLLWLVPALLPWVWPQGRVWWPVLLIAVLGLSEVLAQAGTAPWLSWMADLLPAARAGRFWGVRARVLAVSMVMSALGFGWAMDRWNQPPHALLGFSLVFGVAALLGVADIVVHLGVIEPRPHRTTPGVVFWKRLVAPLRDRAFRRLTLAMGAWTAALALPGYSAGVPGFFNVVYLQENFGASFSQASWLIVASALGTMLWAPAIGHRIDRFGARTVALFLMIAGPLFTLAWLFVSPVTWRVPFVGTVPQPVVLMGVASLVIGGFYSGVQLCQLRLTQVFTGSAGRTVAMAVHWSSVGVIGAAGALAGGWIKDHFPHAWGGLLLPGGTPFSYFQILILLHVLIAWGVALPLLRGVGRDE
ncbi:MAG: hypothetical protein K8R23_05165 [Chthoniobacter sp.]|nr:hypothetical protein [Chthoniobacter sp.]